MKRTLIVMGIFLTLFLAGCGDVVEEQPSAKTSNDGILFWTDEETGCEYIVFRETSGYAGFGGITPRLGTDCAPLPKEDK